MDIQTFNPATPGTYTLLTGTAVPQREPKEYNFSGSIDAPIIYFERRIEANQEYFDPTNCVVEVDRKVRTIRLIENVNSPYRNVITGCAELHPVFATLKINQAPSFNAQQLARLFKMNRYLFASTQEAMRIITELLNFKAEVATKVEQKSDSRGNSANSLERSVQTNAPVTINLKLPIFSLNTFEAAEFYQCEIVLEASGNSVLFGIECLDAQDKFDSIFESIAESNLQYFQDHKIPVLSA